MVWILLFLTLLGSKSYAEGQLIFMEPYVGFSKMEVKDATAGYYDISDNFIIGIRTGVRIRKAFLLGLDYHVGGPYKFGQLLRQASWTTKSLGAILGVDYKVIRFWYGYYPNSRIDDSFNNSSYTGSSQKFGFGLELNPKLRVNIEIMTYKVESAETTNFSPYGTTTYEPRETNAYLSFPVDF